jgi:acyl-CoA thioester hydrolase
VDLLHKTEVTPDQIDHLGHMNVQYYGAHARTGAAGLLASLGLTSDERQTVVQRDTYVRHHREQLVGAPLEVRGGVLDASTARIRLYEELVGAATDEVAASFVLAFEVVDRGSRERVAIAEAVVEAAGQDTVSVPPHGRPRSIDLDADPTERAPSIEVLRQRGLELRRVRTVDPAVCDQDGFALPTAIAELVWGGEPAPGREFRPLEPLEDGALMGFATMETRTTWARFPRAGDRVQSFAAELDIQSKTMLSGHWLFDAERGDLLATFAVVNVAFDIDARRAIVIPDAVRRRLERRYHPDLGSEL